RLPPRGEACPRDRDHLAHDRHIREVAGRVTRGEAMSVARAAEHAEDHARMLDGAVRVEEPRPDRADVGPFESVEERLDPAGAGHLDVAVEKAENVAGRGGGASVHE